jgi:hypothetical protein
MERDDCASEKLKVVGYIIKSGVQGLAQEPVEPHVAMLAYHIAAIIVSRIRMDNIHASIDMHTSANKDTWRSFMSMGR